MSWEKPNKFDFHYRPSRCEQFLRFVWGIRCDIAKCRRRAVGRFGLAQEFGTVTGDLCQKCLDEKLKRIEESEWGKVEKRSAKMIRGLEWHVTNTWKTTLVKYRPSWVGRFLLRVGLDK